MPSWAYRVQMATTRLLSSMLAFALVVELDVLLDELDSPVCSGDDRLHAGAAEPVDD